MTPKEALKEIFNGMYNKQGFIKEFKVIEQALTELEDLRESNKEMRKLLDEAYSKIPSKNNCAKGEIKWTPLIDIKISLHDIISRIKLVDNKFLPHSEKREIIDKLYEVLYEVEDILAFNEKENEKELLDKEVKVEWINTKKH